MSVHQCGGCDQHYCTDCDGISECGGCHAVYCLECMANHLTDNPDCLKAQRAEGQEDDNDD